MGASSSHIDHSTPFVLSQQPSTPDSKGIPLHHLSPKAQERFNHLTPLSPDSRYDFIIHEGSYIEGHIKEGKLQGQGRKVLHDGTCYEGSFKHNLLEGFGILLPAL